MVIVPSRDSAEAARRVVQLVTDSIPRALGIATADIQVVTPVHRGPAGTEALNLALKEVLNPSAAAVGPGARDRKSVSPARRFDVGDRIVAIANHLDEGFANGEVGTVTARTSDGLVITFSGAPVTVPRHLVERPAARLGDHRAPGAGQRMAGGRRGAAARVGRAAHPAADLHRADPGAAPPFGRAGGGRRLARAVRENGGRPRVTRLPALLSDAFGGQGSQVAHQPRWASLCR